MPHTINIDGKDVDVEQVRNDWALALMSQGIIVKLSITRWRGEARLTPETLGVRFVDEDSYNLSRRYIDWGKHKLIPPGVLSEADHIENMARRVLNTYSFDTVWGKFVPLTAFRQWEEENNVLRNDFMEQARIFLTQYDSVMATVKDDYRNIARDVWARLYPVDKGGATLSFIEDFASKIMDKVPSQEAIMDSFKYDVTYSILPMPSFVEENIAKAQDIRRQTEAKEFDSELERETKRRVSEEYIKRKKELIDGFLESTVMSMRNYVGELCNTVLQSLGQQSSLGKVSTKHINKLKEMMKKVKLLNFYNDKDISEALRDLETELDKFKGEMNEGLVVDKLKEIVALGKKEFVPKNFNPSISVLEASSLE